MLSFVQGGLRLAFELLHVAHPEAEVYVSDPTWPNHMKLAVGSGFAMPKKYRYVLVVLVAQRCAS
jgi:aspartate aminotransferase